MSVLQYAPRGEFSRLERLGCSAVEHTRIFAALCRINTLYMIAKAGSGHIGTSFSSLDIVSWLFLNELRRPAAGDSTGPKDIYFSSKGHDVPALYAVLIATGRLDWELLHRLRRLDGLPGHPDVATPGVETNTGSLGMGVSKAKGMVTANRLSGREGRVYVLLGDGELQEGQLWESLVSAANHGMGEIVAIVDHNKIQSDTWVARVSDLGDLDAKFAAYGWHVARCDGHDPEALSAAFNEANGDARPSVIIADTVKGKGVSFMEWGDGQRDEPLYPFHSGAPDRETHDKALAELIAEANRLLHAAGSGDLVLESVERPAPATPRTMQRLIAAYSEALVDAGRKNPKIVSLDGDLVLDTGQIPFRQAFPERFIECGIAEQDMVSQAGGLALQGFLPIVHSFACFLSTRANEQIYNNASERTKVIYVGSLAGVVPGGPGHSHQSVRDISVLGGIPGLDLIEPGCEREVALALDYAVNGTAQSTYLRLVSIPCEVPYAPPADYVLTPGRGVTLRDGADAIVFAYGPLLLPQAWTAAILLEERHGVSLKVVNLPWLNRVDADWLEGAVEGFAHIFTLDNHYRSQGQGEMLAAALAERGLADGARVTRLGLSEFPACGSNDEVLRHHRLDAASLVDGFLETVRCG